MKLNNHFNRNARRSWAAVAAVSIVTVSSMVLGACGNSEASANKAGSGQQGTQSSSGSNGANSANDMQAYIDCLADNGVEMPSRPGDGGQPPGSNTQSTDAQSTDSESTRTPPSMPDQSAMTKAREACADLAPQGGMGPGGQGGPGGADMQAYAKCLSENGVTISQPGQGDGGPPQGEPPSGGGNGTPPSLPDGAQASGERRQGGGTPFGLDTSDPTVKKAVEACADLAPSFPNRGE